MANPLPIESIKVVSKENFAENQLKNTDSEPRLWLIDKPYNWSSFRCVTWVRRTTGTKKVGHAGTLDPMATGLVICAEAKATKSIDLIQGQKKTYRAEITFGASTPSYDAETEIDARADTNHITLEAIREKLDSSFSGEISQIPPMYSAISKDGVRLYKLARQGVEIEREPRKVTIISTVVHSFKDNKLDITIECSKGTYIRSIANDLGKELGSLGYLTALRRTAIGDYNVENAIIPQL